MAQAANIASATDIKTIRAECPILTMLPTLVISLRGRRAATLLNVEKVLSCTFSTRRVRYMPGLGFAGSSACCA
ncbi:MAG TPA: hypothetical protein VN630_07875 [Rhodanobacteraceae bacterium]|nr:hypothetical protein [Rhodanobacteraceae bacterium]